MQIGANMKQIYLDRNQCEQFEVSYFESHSTSLRADIILSSKQHGYDVEHTSFLGKYGTKPVLLERSRDDAPGWYTIMSILKDVI